MIKAIIGDNNSPAADNDTWLPILFGSKTRVKLLKLFLANVDDAYYVRELTRMTQGQINAIRRELENLMKIGIVEIDTEQNKKLEIEELKAGGVIKKGISGMEKKYYRLNKDFVLYEELRKMFNKLRAIDKDTFVRQVDTLGDVRYLTLTGIFTGDESVPIDLLIVGDLDTKRLSELVKGLGEDMPREINYTYLTTEEFLYRREVVDKFIYGILENKNNIVFIDRFNEDQKKGVS